MLRKDAYQVGWWILGRGLAFNQAPFTWESEDSYHDTIPPPGDFENSKNGVLCLLYLTVRLCDAN